MQHLDEGTIHAWLDGALDADESARVARHTAECAECAAAAAEARGLIAASSRVVLSLDVVRGSMMPQQLRHATRRSLWRSLRLTPIRAALAASVLLAAGLTLTLDRVSVDANGRPTRRGVPTVAAPQNTPVAPASAPTRPADAAAGITSRDRAVASNAARETMAAGANSAAGESKKQPAAAIVTAAAVPTTDSATARTHVARGAPAPMSVGAPSAASVTAASQMSGRASRGADLNQAVAAAVPTATPDSAALPVHEFLMDSLASRQSVARVRGTTSPVADARRFNTFGATAGAGRAPFDLAGCYRVAADSSAGVVSRLGFPLRFALEQTQDSSRAGAVRAVTLDGRIDTLFTTLTWRRVAPSVATLSWMPAVLQKSAFRGNGPAPSTLALRFIDSRVLGTTTAPAGHDTVGFERMACRP